MGWHGEQYSMVKEAGFSTSYGIDGGKQNEIQQIIMTLASPANTLFGSG